MSPNNLALREWQENQSYLQAQQYNQRTPEDRAGIEKMNREREELARIEHRVEARFIPQEQMMDELIVRDLSDKQVDAINLMVQGISDADIARTVNVHRATVARWRLFHPTFVAELNRRRQEEIARASDRLRGLALVSIEILEKQLQDESNPELRLKAAITLLKIAGVERAAKEHKPLSAEEMVDDIALARRKRKYPTIDFGEREEAIRDLAVMSQTCEAPAHSLAPSRTDERSTSNTVANAQATELSDAALSGFLSEKPAQQTPESDSDCCATKSRINNELSSTGATGATNNLSPVDDPEHTSESIEIKIQSTHLSKQNKPIIGVIGGIGSGKSFIANLFAELDGRVIHADDLVHTAYKDQNLQKILREWWGDSVVLPDGAVNRKLIADRVFNDPEQLKKLEALVHPLVHAERERLTGQYLSERDCTAVVWDIPLLIETNLHTLCDAVVFVDVSEKVRLERVKTRNWDENELRRRENLQTGLDKKKELANYYISNEADIGSARGQVRQVFSRIIANSHHADDKTSN